MSRYDLTQSFFGHLDRHLWLPILDYLLQKKLFGEKGLLEAKFAVLNNTHMIDVIEDVYKVINNTDSTPQDIQKRREQTLQLLTDSQNACGKLLEILVDNVVVDELRTQNNFTAAYLAEKYEVTESMIDNLYSFSKLNFECGRYRDSADLLYFYRLLSRDDNKIMTGMWGKLAAEILVQNWDVAYQDLKALKEMIDAKVFANQAEQLQQRTWLIHWSLFIFFHLSDGLAHLIDFVFKDDKLMNAIQTNSPYILRYIAVAIISDKRRKQILNEFVRVMKLERNNYSDPLMEFVTNVYVDFNFKAARQSLNDCSLLFDSDYFLSRTNKSEFLEQANLLMFETICRIHKYINLNELMIYLNLPRDDKSERKIVDFIRVARVDAKIDADAHRLVMNAYVPTIYQQVIDKTKLLPSRIHALAAQVEKKYASSAQVDEN